MHWGGSLMTCNEFLERYSDFADDEVQDAEDRMRFEAHLAECGPCMRYHAVLRRGTDLAREAANPSFREDFRERLQHRLYLAEFESRGGMARRGGSGRFLVGGGLVTVSLLLLLGTWRAVTQAFVPMASVTLPPIVAAAPPRAFVPLEGGSLWTRMPSGAGARGVNVRLPASELWLDSNDLLYQHSALHQRHRQGAVIRTGIQ